MSMWLLRIAAIASVAIDSIWRGPWAIEVILGAAVIIDGATLFVRELTKP